MVSNSKDDHPSKITPITNRVPNTIPRTAQQAPKQAPTHLSSPVGREKSKQPMAHRGIQFGYCFHFWLLNFIKVIAKLVKQSNTTVEMLWLQY